MKIEVLDKNEYPHKKTNLEKFFEEEEKKQINKLKERVEKFENTIILEYDENGNAIFTPITSLKFPNVKDYKK